MRIRNHQDCAHRWAAQRGATVGMASARRLWNLARLEHRGDYCIAARFRFILSAS